MSSPSGTDTVSCSFDGCHRKVRARGLCQTHYVMQRKGLPLRPIRPKAKGPPRTTKEKAPCAFPGCDRLVVSLGYCSGHYAQLRTGKPLFPLFSRKTRAGVDRGCSVEGCDRPHDANGLCNAHAKRQRAGKPLVPLTAPKRRWKDVHGYVRVPDPAGGRRSDGSLADVPEHRVIMEEMIGRPLLPDETVHHVNGVRDDNRPENLELWSSSHPPGQRWQDKLAWAREIVARYGSWEQQELFPIP